MQSTRQTPRSSPVRARSLVAALLALGLVAAIAAVAWAAPSPPIVSGPSGPTNDAQPSFSFTTDDGTTTECSIDPADQVTPAYAPCTSPYTPDAPLPDGDYVFHVRATDDQLEQTEASQSFSVDTAAPSLSISSGPSGPTNDRTPQFGFAAEAGATVECSVDDGTPVYGPCTTASSHTAPALADGSYVFHVRATDAAGNQASASQAFTVDSEAPSLSIDSGPSGPTNDRTPSFGFAAEAGATVQCSVDEGSPAFAPCTSPFTPASPLPDGSYTFRVRATDTAGNATLLTRSFSVDTAPPSLSISSGPSGPTSDRTPQFGFAAEAGATVECSVDDGTPVYGPCSSGSSHTAAALADGSYVFHVRATDAAGNQTVRSQAFSVDTVAPTVGVVSGPTITSDRTPTFGFTAEAGATVQCSIDQGSPAFAPCTSPFTPGAPLLDGNYTFRVRATDRAGNQASDSQPFTIDSAPPSLTIDSGPSGTTRDNTPQFGFTAEARATVECSVDDGTAAYGPCSSGSSHTAATLADGAYVFHVRATDAAGNQTVRSRAFSVDTVAPAVGGISGPSGPTNDRTPSFGFTVTDVSATSVECSVDHGTAAYGPCTTATSHTAAALADGSWVFHVRATDAAGNQTERSQAFSVDLEAPSLSIDSGPAEPTNDVMPSFGFTAEAGTTLECSIDQATLPYGPCTSAATYVVGTPLAEGTHVFRVRATDEVGNDAIVSFTFTVDTTPPSLSIGFGPSGTTNDSTPLFGFSAEPGATVECSIDQGVPAYGPCASATTDAAVAPLADGAYTFRVRATDRAGNQTTNTRAFTVDTVPDTPGPTDPRPDPTPPVTTPVTPPARPQLLSPFPLVRISGTLTSTGARIRVLSVRAPRGALVRVTVSPACSGKRRSSRRCRVLQAAGTVGRHDLISFRGLERTYRSGTVIVVRVWRADRIGKYTRFTIRRGKAPRRVDQCLVPEATLGSRCPSA